MAAAKNAEKNPLTSMPFNRYEATMMAAVSTSHLMKRPLMHPPLSLKTRLFSFQLAYQNSLSTALRQQPPVH
jgi:hypothetical protein